MGFDFIKCNPHAHWISKYKTNYVSKFLYTIYKRTGKSCQTSLVAGICIFLELASFITVMASFKNPLPKYLLTRKNLIIGAGRKSLDKKMRTFDIIGFSMVFCYQNYSDLLWEKNVLVIEQWLRSLEQFIQTAKGQNNFW